MGFGKGVREATLGEDDDGAMDSGPDPGDMGMVEEGSPLAYDGEVVGIALSALNWALRYVGRSICPSTPQLPDTMPAFPIDPYAILNR